MEKTMLDYFHEQPEVLAAIFEDRKANTAPFAELYGRHRPDTLYCIASGSSYNAARAAAPFMQQVLDRDVMVCPSSRLPKVRAASPLVLFISQGGSSTNTIAAIKAMAGYPALALTGKQASRIGEISPHHMLIPCGEETAGPKTKGYTSTVLLLCLMALEAAAQAGTISGEEYEAYTSQFAEALAGLEEAVSTTESWCCGNLGSLRTVKKCVVVGKGAGAEVAAEGALKLLETMLIPAAGYEFEEFLHGPVCGLDCEMAGVYLLPPKGDVDYERMLRLARFHREICPAVFIVGAGHTGDVRDCAIPPAAQGHTGVFGWVLPCQMMGARLPALMGVGDRGHQLFLKLDKALGVKYEGGS